MMSTKEIEATPPPPLRAWDALGFSVGGPLICGMVDWLASRLAELPEPHQIWFLARDGEIFHKVWQLRSPETFRAWQNHYILLSHRALQVPAFRDLDLPTQNFLASRLRDLSPAAIRHSLGLDPGPKTDVHQPIPRDQLPGFLAQLKTELQIAAAREKTALRHYLDSFLQPDQPPVAVVDVGWRGTQQALLQKFLPQKPPLHGFYLALLDNPILPLAQNSFLKGFHGHPQDKPQVLPAMRELVHLVELFTGTTTPGLDHFQLSMEGQPQPVFSSQNLSSYQLQAFTTFQKAILRFARNHPDPVDHADAVHPLFDLGLHPYHSELAAISSLRVSVLGETGKRPILQVPHAHNALLKPGFLTRAFRRSLWRPGFLAALPRPLATLCRMYSPHNYKKVRRARHLHPQRTSPPFA